MPWSTLNLITRDHMYIVSVLFVDHCLRRDFILYTSRTCVIRLGAVDTDSYICVQRHVLTKTSNKGSQMLVIYSGRFQTSLTRPIELNNNPKSCIGFRILMSIAYRGQWLSKLKYGTRWDRRTWNLYKLWTDYGVLRICLLIMEDK